MVISSFIPSVTGMEAQSHALGQVSTNIANFRTVGYKTTETMFYTLLGSQPAVKGGANSGNNSSRVDINGVGYYDRTNIDFQALVSPTGNNFDVAINGTGNAFFQINDPSGRSYYTRAGNFATRIEGGVPYLVAQNGMKVQGFPYNNPGFGASPSDIVVDPLKKIPSIPTTKLGITANVPADGADTSTYGLTLYGPNNDGRATAMVWTKVVGEVNAWDVSFTATDGTVTSPPTKVTFNNDGTLLTPKTLDVAVTWNEDAGGGSNNVTIDISKMTQYAGSSGTVAIDQDGGPGGNLVKTYIDDSGIVQAQYSNSKTVPIAKLTIVGFAAPNNLIAEAGTVFAADASAGESFYLDPTTTKLITPQALEQSAVNMEQEFSKLILVQRAYTLNTSSFTANDEMLQTIVNLKS